MTANARGDETRGHSFRSAHVNVGNRERDAGALKPWRMLRLAHEPFQLGYK